MPVPPSLVGAIDVHVGAPDALNRRNEELVAVCSGAALQLLHPMGLAGREVVTRSRTPVSTSTGLAHSCSICGTHPTLGAMNSMAAQNDAYFQRCSCAILTARSRTSGENLFDLLLAQSSQRVFSHLKSRGDSQLAHLEPAKSWYSLNVRNCESHVRKGQIGSADEIYAAAIILSME